MPVIQLRGRVGVGVGVLAEVSTPCLSFNLTNFFLSGPQITANESPAVAQYLKSMPTEGSKWRRRRRRRGGGGQSTASALQAHCKRTASALQAHWPRINRKVSRPEVSNPLSAPATDCTGNRRVYLECSPAEQPWHTHLAHTPGTHNTTTNTNTNTSTAQQPH
jgi:hypothetical protein